MLNLKSANDTWNQSTMLSQRRASGHA